MGISVPNGVPGFKTAKETVFRNVIRQGQYTSLSKPRMIDGSKSRDTGNTGNLATLRPGLLMGLVTASGKYAPSIIGVLQSAASSTDTSVTVTAAQATELERRVGTTGTIRFVGPPSAAGTVATFTETYSAINTTTGVITCSGLDADLIAGTFVCDTDGTHEPITLLVEEAYDNAIKVTDSDGTNIDRPLAKLPIAGVIETAQILPEWPSDTSLQQWIEDHLNGQTSDTGDGAGSGKFVFDHKY